MNLDDAATLAAADPGGMLRQVADLPHQLGQSAALRAQVSVAVAALGRPNIDELVVCGMGGSAIGADYAAAWAAPHGVRVHVHRGYGAPRWSGARPLFVFSSYSGDTEETLDALAATPEGAPRLCLTTGGMLAARAADARFPVIALPTGLQPRAALGAALVALVWLLHETALVPESPAATIGNASAALAALAHDLAPGTPEARNRAKQLARECADHLVWIVSGNGCLEPVARRWKGQISENAKSMAIASTVPEMNHNEIMAPPRPHPVCSRLRLLCLDDRDDPEPVRRRLRLTSETLTPHVAGATWLAETAPDRLTRLLGATLLADYTSVYMAFLHGVDPTPVQRIQDFKARLRSA